MRLSTICISVVLACAGVGGASAGEAVRPPAFACFVPDLPRFSAALAAHPCARAAAWPVDAAWKALISRGVQLRAGFDILPRHGGMPACEATVGILTPDGTDPPAPGGLRTQRDGAWCLVGMSSRPMQLPPEIRLPAPAMRADLTWIGHLPDWTRLLSGAPAEACLQLLSIWRLSTVQSAVDLAGGRWHDRTRLPGAALPLRPIAGEALDGIPAEALAVVAAGIDGPALARGTAQFLTLAEVDAEAVGQLLQDGYAITAEELAAAVDGTVTLSLHGDVAQPDVLIGVASSARLQDLLVRWLERSQPEQGAALVAAAAEQPVPFWWPGTRPMFVRLARERIWLSNQPELLTVVGSDPAQPYPIASRWPNAAGAVVLAHWGEGVAAGVLGGSPGVIATAVGACKAAGLAAPAGSLVVHQDAGGVRIAGDHALAWVAPLIGLAPAWGPAVAAAQSQADGQVVLDNLRIIMKRARAFSVSTSGHWPRDVADLRAWAKELTDEQFAQAGRPHLPQPFCYVPPLVEPPGDQPVLVQDPVVHDGRGSLVGFADGRVEFREGVVYWQEARRLSALAAARNVGVDMAEWATTPKTY